MYPPATLPADMIGPSGQRMLPWPANIRIGTSVVATKNLTLHPGQVN